MHMITYSNWAKVKLFETDFSAAIIPKPGTDSVASSNMKGRPVYVHNNQFSLTLPNCFFIIGKDNSGYYLLSR